MRLCARVLRGHSKSSLLLSAAAAVLLSACSSDMERFADNPTEGNDSIYTASVPKSVQQGGAGSSDEMAVSGRPLANTSIKPGQSYASNGYNYQKSYAQKPAYRQPQYQSEDRQPSATVRV